MGIIGIHKWGMQKTKIRVAQKKPCLDLLKNKHLNMLKKS
jgi:hypothetical protein